MITLLQMETVYVALAVALVKPFTDNFQRILTT